MPTSRGTQREQSNEAWDRYIQESNNRAMRLFGAIARRKGLSMRTVAQRIGVDLRAFQRYFESKKPTLRTMTPVAKALDYPPLIARALVGELTTQDIYVERAIIRGDINTRGEVLFDEYAAMEVGRRFYEWSAEKANREAVAAACEESILARFKVVDNPPDILGPELGAVERVLAPHGLSLRSHIHDERAIMDRQREGNSWFSLLCDTLGILEQDQMEIRRILVPYGIRNLEAEMEEVFPSSPEGKERHFTECAAQVAAEEAYRKRIGGEIAFEYISADLMKEATFPGGKDAER